MTDSELELRLEKIEQDIAELKEAYQDLASGVEATASNETLIQALQEQVTTLQKALQQCNSQVATQGETLKSHTTTLEEHTTKITALEEGALSGQFADGELLLSNFVKESTESRESE